MDSCWCLPSLLTRRERDMVLDPMEFLLLFFHPTAEPRAEHQAQREREQQVKCYLNRGEQLLGEGSVDGADIRFELASRLWPDIVSRHLEYQRYW